MTNHQTPQYLFDTISPHFHDNNGRYNLRHIRIFEVPQCRTESYKKSFFPATMATFNNIDHEVVHSSSTGMFSNYINLDKHEPTITTLFKYCLPRNMNIIICQLRNACSNLNADCFNDHLVDDPGCQCGHVYEDAKHYYFACELHEHTRPLLHEVYQSLGYINANILLNGVLFADDVTKKYILDRVISFIILSKRFNA